MTILLGQSMAEQRKSQLLVFGGNGFLGGETVMELLPLNAFDITVVNRGNWKNFDSNYRIRPFVKTINIDRCECMTFDYVLFSVDVYND